MQKHLSAILVSIVFFPTTSICTAQGVSTVAKLVNVPRSLNNNFGQAVAISGEYAVVGTSADDEDAAGANPLPEAGAAYVFRNVGGAWAFQQKIVAADRAASDYFGSAVAIDGDYIIVGAQKQDGDAGGAAAIENAGAAYIFMRDAATGSWSQQQKITAPAALRATGDCFGYSVAISENAAVVGAYLDNEDGVAIGNNTAADAGAAYVFRRSGTTWAVEQKLIAADRQPGDLFGFSVSMSGDDILVGARLNDLNASGGSPVTNAGAAYVFHRNGSAWAQQQKLVAADRAANDAAGYAVAIHGDFAVVGAPQEDEDAAGANSLANAGSAYIFQRSGSAWTQLQKVVSGDRTAADRLGFSVSISGDRMMLGAPGKDAAGGQDAGAAYVFKKSAGVWTQEEKIEASDRQSFDEFGKTVAMFDEEIMVGAATSNLDAVGANPVENAGAAYLYTVSTPLSVGGLQLTATPFAHGQCRLHWQALGQEAEGVQYSVARSLDGQTFEVLTNGAYTQRITNREYQLVDDDLPNARHLYYRVAAHTADGGIMYSNIAVFGRSVNTNGISAWPVPAASTLLITGGAGDAVITDMQGRVVTRLILQQFTAIDVSTWPGGAYLLRPITGEALRFEKL